MRDTKCEICAKMDGLHRGFFTVGLVVSTVAVIAASAVLIFCAADWISAHVSIH